MKAIVMADGKIDIDEAETVRAFVKPLVGEAAIFHDFREMITEIIKDGVIDFDEQLAILKVINKLLDYLNDSV